MLPAAMFAILKAQQNLNSKLQQPSANYILQNHSRMMQHYNMSSGAQASEDTSIISIRGST